MPDYLGYFPEPFLEDIVQGRCLPFIGAGFSLNVKVPKGKKMLDWDGLGKKVAAALYRSRYANRSYPAFFFTIQGKALAA